MKSKRERQRLDDWRNEPGGYEMYSLDHVGELLDALLASKPPKPLSPQEAQRQHYENYRSHYEGIRTHFGEVRDWLRSQGSYQDLNKYPYVR